MSPLAAYEELVCRSQERAILSSCLEVLGWDELTFMPHGGDENRGRQTAYLAGMVHQSWADPRIGELLAAAAEFSPAADPESPEAVNLREWRRTHERLVRLPRALVQELAAVCTTGQQLWADARRDDDFRQFLPSLERIVRLKREEAECLKGSNDTPSPHGFAGGEGRGEGGERSSSPPHPLPLSPEAGERGAALEPLKVDGTKGSPGTSADSLYDSLLDEYEPGATAAQLSTLFDALRAEIVPLLAEIVAAPRRGRPGVLTRSYPEDRQRMFIEAVAAEIGFDFSRGRLDTTTHPFFSTIGPGDCRITTRFHANDFGEGFFSSLHEVGHALYEQGLDTAHYGTPFGEAAAMGLHESQSRLWENFIGRSLSFWRRFFPRARETFHDALHGVTLADFHRAVNHVQPGLNRVRADAATYDLHILVRFELERALIAGDLPPSDLPAAWKERYRALLGVVPETDAEGCLQDGHWGAGQFGYFPTYTLGNLIAAQLFAALRRDMPDLESNLAVGEFAPLRGWLADRIYRHGRRFTSDELLRRITGSGINHQPLVALLRERYEELYGL